MASIGGPLEFVTLAGRYFAVAADTDSNRKLGGTENEVQANGDGSARVIKTIVPSMLSDVSVQIDDSNGDQEFLQDLANGGDFFPVTVGYLDGSKYSGRMQLTGEIQFSNQSATASISLMGPAALKKQA